ncbi:MAG: DASH complex subunit dam1 [Peltula sp. TS41687]|nr:MAG: DASH complex subunit dam1 [Peltula sp. TS41687]
MSTSETSGDGQGKQRESRNRLASSRPTTPLRPASRASGRDGQPYPNGSRLGSSSQFPLDALEPAFAELSDSLADLEANLMHIQLMHESLARFNENFASFLYGLNMNAFCVDFPEAPIRESHKRHQQPEALSSGSEQTRFVLSLIRGPYAGALRLLFWIALQLPSDQPPNPLVRGINPGPLNLPVVGRAVPPVGARGHL